MNGQRGGTSPVFIYLHGFGSSPASSKATIFRTWAERHDLPLELLDLRVPSFEYLLLSAMEVRVKEAIDAAGGPRSRAVLIGSSLGGLTACRVAEADPRVCALFLLSPTFEVPSRLEARLGKQAWADWKTSGFLEVDDSASKQKARVHWGFVEELARIDAERGTFPDVRVPTRIVHGTRDNVIDVELSRSWSKGKRFVSLVELDDVHELAASGPRIQDEADDFFRPFLGPAPAS